MNDDLFNPKNAVSLKKAARHSAFHGNGAHGGKMSWRKLLSGCCPRCGYKLQDGNAYAKMTGGTSGRILSSGTLVCENPNCSFAITASKANSITAEMREPKREVEDNQSYLNNL